MALGPFGPLDSGTLGFQQKLLSHLFRACDSLDYNASSFDLIDDPNSLEGSPPVAHPCAEYPVPRAAYPGVSSLHHCTAGQPPPSQDKGALWRVGPQPVPTSCSPLWLCGFSCPQGSCHHLWKPAEGGSCFNGPTDSAPGLQTTFQMPALTGLYALGHLCYI